MPPRAARSVALRLLIVSEISESEMAPACTLLTNVRHNNNARIRRIRIERPLISFGIDMRTELAAFAYPCYVTSTFGLYAGPTCRRRSAQVTWLARHPT